MRSNRRLVSAIRMSRPALIALLVALLFGGAACGHKIGDTCGISADCSQDGTRVCDIYSVGGYCTIAGCDYNTCPSEAVCVEFFPGVEDAVSCTGPADCARDELCTVGGQCAPVSLEQRFCMLSCSSDGDCRDGYECRTLEVMKKHGGQPVPDPTATTTAVPNQPFCAARRPCTGNPQCDTGEHCDASLKVCLPS
jgi:hypothetical protein